MVEFMGLTDAFYEAYYEENSIPPAPRPRYENPVSKTVRRFFGR